MFCILLPKANKYRFEVRQEPHFKENQQKLTLLIFLFYRLSVSYRFLRKSINVKRVYRL